MNDQQRTSRRAYDDAARLRNQAASDAINRANKVHRDQAIKAHRDQHQRMVENSLRAGRRSGENVHDVKNATGKFIMVFIAMAVTGILLFALFVLIVSGLQSSPFG
jgi:hypothetical protein